MISGSDGFARDSCAASATGRGAPIRAGRVLLLGLLLCLYAALGHAAEVGQPAPAWQVRTLDGKVVDAATTKGEVVLVHFWATWCPPCREELPALQAYYQAHHKDGLEIVAVSLDDDRDIAKVRQVVQHFSFPVAMQDATQTAGFGRIWVLPLSFLIDREGILREVDWTGERRIDQASLDRYVLPWLKKR